MTSNEIQESIQKWGLISPDSELVVASLDQGNCFFYDFPEYAQASESLHAYPGIYQDQLYFFMIPSSYDKEEYMMELDLYCVPCLVEISLGSGHEITSAQAKARIKAWDNNYQAWVPSQVEGPYGIFLAFAIPTDDFELETVKVTLGLEVNASAAGGFGADLIVTNQDGKNIVYDDFSKVVPPFDAAIAEEDFALLSVNN